MFPTMTQGVAGNGKLRKSSWTTSTDAEAVFFVSLAASFASTSTAVIALPKWDIGWVRAPLPGPISMMGPEVCFTRSTMELMILWSVRKFWPCS
ncbi:hypothetical protein HMPREF2899_03710 [Corynebacterium sp. HMSC072D01]|nr:hypothetical protein HMPREF2899_03710 [Corynebacterium sp. HMSC072D01]